MFGKLHGVESLYAAIQRGRGVLLVSPHLGNWEFGGPLLAREGIPLLALTLVEPHSPLTQLRQQARSQHGIDTLVIQQDPFAFLQVIQRLQEGKVVALLIDRPPAAVAVRVELFGRPILASGAPADLARASGCVILPVCLLRTPGGQYDAHVLPAVDYDQVTLRDPEARRRLSQEILRAFEPLIRQCPEQWFHFVPLWPPS
jgi:KDO2-lipid IV(A) lauroyltransferase